MVLHRFHDTIICQAHFFLHAFDNADIRLMGHQPVDLLHIHSGRIQNFIHDA